ncbi:MAG: alpha/beta hydrolase-fold protein [Eubacteriales bacterium]|nr:alpha/beta hydrolase-fold protein [Eubacteriales bacterium]
MAHFSCNFISYTLNRAVDINVIVPTLAGPDMHEGCTHQITEKYPVLYLLHGGINDYSTWERYTSIERYAEERRIAVVTCSGENNCYIDTRNPAKAGALLGQGVDYYSFVSVELPDFVSSMFPVSTDPAHVYMAGLSMGGYGTMLHGFTQPERFRALGVFSATANMDDITQGFDEPEKWNLSALLKAATAQGKKIPPMYCVIGDQDFMFHLWPGHLQLLEEAGVACTHEVVEGYGHEWALWDLEVARFLDWIPRDDGYYKQAPKRRI